MRKFLTVLLSLMMVVTMMPVMTGVAFADTPSNWAKLATAMSGGEQETVTNVFEVSDNNATGIRTITLLSDITATADDRNALAVSADKTVVLDLNGHTIDRGLTGEKDMADGYVIKVEGELTMEDSSDEECGVITGGNNNEHDGSGIIVENGGSFTMNNGSIAKNKSCSGGGVNVSEGGTFTMNGGSIIENTAAVTGGGVYNNGEFIINGGNITNNTAQNGGGVFVYLNGIANLTGGTISNNNASKNGGGVVDGGKITLGGTVVIDGNTLGGGKTANNLFLVGKEIEISTETTPTDMRIGVTTMGDVPVAFTTNGTEDDVKYFFADKEDEYVTFEEGHLKLCKVPGDNYKINIAYSENGTVTADKQFTTPSDLVTLTVKAAEGYKLKNLTVAKKTSSTDIKTSQTDLNAGEYTFEMPADNVTVTATFEKERYEIYIEECENGNVEVTGESAQYEDPVTLTVTPAEGYKLETLTVKTSPTDINTSPTNIPTTRKGDSDEYTFNMPANNVTVKATFMEKETEKTTPSNLNPLLVAAGVTATTAAVVTTGVVVGKVVKKAVDAKKAKAEAEKEPAPQEPTVQEEPKPTEPTTPTFTADQVKEAVDGLTIRCNTKKTADGTKVYAKVTDGDLEALEAAGYTVSYKFYRSKYAKKSYKLMKTTAKANYTNTKGTDGKMYYYKAKVVVTDKDGNEVAITAIKDCKYGNRKF